MAISQRPTLEVQRLCSQFVARERSIKNEITTLESRVRDLRTEQQDARLQFDEAIIQHAKSECMQLARLISNKLPRELRNMIYEALCPTDDVIRVPDPIQGPLRSGSEQYHFLDPQYVGDIVAMEACERYYGGNSFDLDAGVLDHVLRPQLPTGPRPCDMIRTLCVRVGDEQVYKHIYMDDELDYDGRELQLDYLRTVHANLQSLRPLSPMQTLNVEFRILTIDFTSAWWDSDYVHGISFITERYIFNMLETLRDTMYALKFAGAKVTLIYDEFLDDRKFEEEVEMDIDGGLDWRDMTSFLAMDEDSWRKEKVGDSAWAPGKSFLSMLLPLYESRDDPMVQLFRRTLERRWGTRHLGLY